jgi:drug/metabolite transporter (DMT)-like permease
MTGRTAGAVSLLLLIPVTMVAFASNSIINRLAVEGGYASPAGFAVLRVIAGAVMLVLLLRLRGGARMEFMTRARLVGAGSLALYMTGFSLAYVALDAGLGALILFGVVQITMFSIAALRGAAPDMRQLIGAGVAFCGLILVLDPGGASLDDLRAAAFMVAAGIGWGIYSIAGKAEADALAGTAANFCLALPLTVLAALLAGQSFAMDARGAALAVLGGAVTSGLGYSMWYQILPRIASSSAAILQLAVPVLAVCGGVLLLGESVGLQFLFGACLVLGGIAFSLVRKRGRSG